MVGSRRWPLGIGTARAMDQGHTYPQELVESIDALSKLVLSEEDLPSTLQRIVENAVHAIDGAEHCSLSIKRKGEIENLASTGPIGKRLDALQHEVDEGPCLSSIEEEATFCIPDIESDETWPRFSRRAAEETDTESMLCFVLDGAEEESTALNLISSHKDAFHGDDIATGAVFAAQARVALLNARTHADDQDEITNLKEAIKTREIIGQAVGIVMATHHVDSQEAFLTLKRISQNANVKLRIVASQLVEKTAGA